MNEIVGPLYYVFAQHPDEKWKGERLGEGGAREGEGGKGEGLEGGAGDERWGMV